MATPLRAPHHGRVRIGRLIVVVFLVPPRALVAVAADASTQQPAAQPDLFHDPDDGAFDVSNFLSTRVGFLPIAMPITEPAVGYGLSLGLTFLHDTPQAVNYPGQPPRVIMPSITAIFGAGTE